MTFVVITKYAALEKSPHLVQFFNKYFSHFCSKSITSSNQVPSVLTTTANIFSKSWTMLHVFRNDQVWKKNQNFKITAFVLIIKYVALDKSSSIKLFLTIYFSQFSTILEFTFAIVFHWKHLLSLSSVLVGSLALHVVHQNLCLVIWGIVWHCNSEWV